LRTYVPVFSLSAPGALASGGIFCRELYDNDVAKAIDTLFNRP
jgi:hypothetical protein